MNNEDKHLPVLLTESFSAGVFMFLYQGALFKSNILPGMVWLCVLSLTYAHVPLCNRGHR